MPSTSALFRALFGLSVFNAQKGHGSFITCGLTSTPATPEEHIYLWVYMCTWKIWVAGKEIAHSESPDEVIATSVAALNGHRVEALALHEVLAAEGTYHAATLHLSDRVSLRMEQYDDSAADTSIFSICIGADHWVSYDSDGYTREDTKT
jgi:hypothetical protein